MCGDISSFFTLSPGWVSIPKSFVSVFVFYILFYLLSKRLGCLSGCLVSSPSVQKLFCGSCSTFNSSFDKFVGEKVVSPSIPLPSWDNTPTFFLLGRIFCQVKHTHICPLICNLLLKRAQQTAYSMRISTYDIKLRDPEELAQRLQQAQAAPHLALVLSCTSNITCSPPVSPLLALIT